MISLPNDPTTYKPQRLWTGSGTLVLALFLLLLFAVLPTLAADSITALTDTWHCVTNDCDPKGPAVSLEQQLAVANAEITKVSGDYVLTDIEFGSAAFKEDARQAVWNSDKAFEITFSYVISNGLKYDVSLWDVKPSSTVKINRNKGMPSKKDYDAALAQGALRPEQIKISPRQAAEHAWSTFREQERIGDIEFRDGRLTQAKTDVWIVSLQPTGAESTSSSYWTYFLVDVATGEATMYNFYDYHRAVFPPKTPTPSP